MSASFSTTGSTSGSDTWQQLEDVLAGLSELARAGVPPERFYAALLDQSVRAISAVGGAVWLRAPGGVMKLVAQTNWPGAELAADDDARRAHEALLTNVAARGETLCIAPRSAQDGDSAGNPSEHVLLLGPVRAMLAAPPQASSTTGPADSQPVATVAIVELLQRGDASPAAYRGYEQFVAAVCELAADHHAYGELARLRGDDQYREQLLRLSRRIHGDVDLRTTVYAVANEARPVVGCDRLSVLVARGRRCRLMATSGVSRIERRSSMLRQLEKLADLVRQTVEPAYYADGQCDALPPIDEALEAHADQSHARQIAVLPLSRPPGPAEEFDAGSTRAKREVPSLVLVAEQFDAHRGNLDRQRLADVGDVCATALYAALDVDRLPLRGLLRPLGTLMHQIATHVTRTAAILAAAIALVAALLLVKTDFRVEAPGTLQPTVQRHVFAPRDGLVDEVLVAHGEDVSAGQPLARLRDPTLDLEIKRVFGEMETTRRQLDAVRAARTNRDVRDSGPTDVYRLSADENEARQRLENLQRESELLAQEREQLVIRSPIDGRVLTWDLGNQLVARPVHRGEVLVTVADLSADWELELEVPDERVGYMMAAREAIGPDLPVRFRLRSDDEQLHLGHITEVSLMADVNTGPAAPPTPNVRVMVAINADELNTATRQELRPGLSARAQIECGRRSVGYVWLHDVWDRAVGWVEF